MTCRMGVSKFVSGEGSKRDDNEHNLVTVYDMGLHNQLLKEGKNPEEEPKCYRSINLEGLMFLKIGGQEYVINEFPLCEFEAKWHEGGVNKSRFVRARTEGEAKEAFKRLMKIKRVPNGTEFRCVRQLQDTAGEAIVEESGS